MASTSPPAPSFANETQPVTAKIGTQLIKYVLIPAAILIPLFILGIVAYFLWRRWKTRQQSKRNLAAAQEIALEQQQPVEIAALPPIARTSPSTSPDRDTMRWARRASEWNRHRSSRGLTVPLHPKKVKPKASGPTPPAPQLRGVEGDDDISELDLDLPATSK